MMPEDVPGAPPAGHAGRWAALAWLFVAIGWGAWIRVHTALGDPNFDWHDARGMMRSDPALLFYLTEEISESLGMGRGTPEDFRADPRIQHPFVTDVPREFPVAQEFVVAWSDALWRALGGAPAPLHVVALVVMALVASLFVVGVFVGVRALTRSDLWASLAVLLALVTPANYRTLGFLLVGEDIALPFFVLHLGWLARFARTGRARDALLSGCLAAGALSTWHAASFVLALELGVFLIGTLGRGRSPLERPSAWLVLVGPLVAGALVPVLRANGLFFSPAAALVLAMLAPGVWRRRRPLTPLQARLLCAGVLGAALLGLGALAPSSYVHVHQVVWDKLRLFGHFPDDPGALSFDARLLWQGPFETMPLADLLAWCGWPLAVLLAVALTTHAVRRELSGFEAFLLGLLVFAVPLSWMFQRLAVLVGLLAPLVVVVAFAHWRRRGLALALLGAFALAEAGLFAGFVGTHRIQWYLPRPARQELAALVEFVAANVPRDEPILGDFVNSTALLAHTRNPIVLQPKYETDRSRRQAEAFLTAFFQGSTEALAELMRGRFRCRYLLVDRHVLWDLSRPTAGIPAGESAPRAGTAAEAFLSSDGEVLCSIPGFELVYRGAPGIPLADYRLFRLAR